MFALLIVIHHHRLNGELQVDPGNLQLGAQRSQWVEGDGIPLHIMHVPAMLLHLRCNMKEDL